MFKFTDDQRNASISTIKWLSNPLSKYMVIQGSAGTGKTALIKHLLTNIIRSSKYSSSDIDMLATTNKATGVLVTMSNKPVKTLYSYLKMVPKEDYKTGELHFVKGRNYKQIHDKLLIIDEGSYIDDDSFKMLDEATVNCKVIFVGDWYQLIMPPREEEEESENTPKTPVMQRLNCHVTMLEEVVRHNNDIAKLGAQCRDMVKTGIFTSIVVNGKDIVHLGREECINRMDKVFHRKTYVPESACVIAWTNQSVIKANKHIRFKRGMLGHVTLNETLITNKPIVNKRGKVASSDTSVKITRVLSKATKIGIAGVNVCLNGSSNVYFMPYNQVAVKKLLTKLKKVGYMKDFWDIKNTWLDLRPEYSSTVHKSQGSTFDVVFVNLSDIGACDDSDSVARMLYVAITRASKQVILYGELPEQYGGAIK